MAMQREQEPSGCALALLGVNALLMGLLFLSFSQGPYSSPEQERWYRYGSLAFLLGGAVLPALAIFLGARRSAAAMVGLIVWMLAALAAFIFYAMMSGGGV